MPAVNPGISVSRVGGDAQIKAMKKLPDHSELIYSQYRELQSFAQFGSDLDADTKGSSGTGCTYRRSSETEPECTGSSREAGSYPLCGNQGNPRKIPGLKRM